MTPTPTYYTVTLRTGVRFVASIDTEGQSIPGTLCFRPLLLEDRPLFIPLTSVDIMATIEGKEAMRTAKYYHTTDKFRRLFGEVVFRLRKAKS